MNSQSFAIKSSFRCHLKTHKNFICILSLDSCLNVTADDTNSLCGNCYGNHIVGYLMRWLNYFAFNLMTLGDYVHFDVLNIKMFVQKQIPFLQSFGIDFKLWPHLHMS